MSDSSFQELCVEQDYMNLMNSEKKNESMDLLALGQDLEKQVIEDKMKLVVHEPKQYNRWQVEEECFELENCYKVIDYLGAGAYGVVCAAYDSSKKRVVAIKKCKKIFQSRTMAKRTLRELRILRLLNHENIIKILSILPPMNSASFSEVYIEFELMETDLASIIRSQQVLRDDHIQFFTFQILCALAHLHDVDIYHRDLKPRNILVNSNCQLKIADFGLARVTNPKSQSKTLAMTEYVTTRWYRAPEILVGWHKYTSAVDIWAVGTILAEMLGRKPIFPGEHSMKQLELIAGVIGKPPESFIQMCRKPSYRHFLRELKDCQPIPFSVLYPNSNHLALDLLRRMLEIHPERRISARASLSHAYVWPSTVNKKVDTPPPIIPLEEFLFEEHKAEVEELKEEMIKEIRYYMPICELQKELYNFDKASGTSQDIMNVESNKTKPCTAANTGISNNTMRDPFFQQQAKSQFNRDEVSRKVTYKQPQSQAQALPARTCAAPSLSALQAAHINNSSNLDSLSRPVSNQKNTQSRRALQSSLHHVSSQQPEVPFGAVVGLTISESNNSNASNENQGIIKNKTGSVVKKEISRLPDQAHQLSQFVASEKASKKCPGISHNECRRKSLSYSQHRGDLLADVDFEHDVSSINNDAIAADKILASRGLSTRHSVFKGLSAEDILLGGNPMDDSKQLMENMHTSSQKPKQQTCIII